VEKDMRHPQLAFAVNRATACGLPFLLLSASSIAAPGGWVPYARLSSPHPAAGNHYGAAVAMSGTTLVVGEPFADVASGIGAGNVYVYERVGSHWQLVEDLQQQPFNFAYNHAHFGAAVAVSGDKILVGAPDADCCIPTVAQIGFWIFYQRDPATGHWVFTDSSSGSEAGERQGAAVAIDGTIGVSGAPGAGSSGLAYALALDAKGNFQTLFPGSAQVGLGFGSSVAIVQTPGPLGAQVLVVGAPGYKEGAATNVGAAFVFNFFAGHWHQFQALNASTPQDGNAFGSAVATSGNRVYVGVPGRNNPHGAAGVGSVDVFVASGPGGGFEIEQAIYTMAQSTDAHVGSSLAYSQDPTPLLYVGAPLGNSVATDAGSSFLFDPVSNGSTVTWTEVDRLVLGADAAASDHLGTSVAISGLYAATGVPLHDGGAELADSGIVEIFARDLLFADGFQ
jgi:FG-GAP repeat